ncbi:hypothetical protein ACHWQZ_G000117 [Mnemiopsis leidyi]
MGTGESKPLQIIGIASAGVASFFDLLATCILFHPDAWATEMTLVAFIISGLCAVIRTVEYFKDIGPKTFARSALITAAAAGLLALTAFIGYSVEISDSQSLLEHKTVTGSYVCLTLSLPAHVQNIGLGLVRDMIKEEASSAFTPVVKKQKVSKGKSAAVKPYVCDQPGCFKSFSQLGYLQAHLYTHSEGPLYQCRWNNECGRRFSDLGNLKKHMLTHTGERPYSCDWQGCGKSFSQVGNLNTHKHTHTGKRPYKCSLCPKAYNQSTALKRHVRSHTGEKPFRCDHCTKRFSNSSHLKAHLRVHTGERPYTCITCGKKFSQHSGLHGHLKTHIRPEPLAALSVAAQHLMTMQNIKLCSTLHSYIVSMSLMAVFMAVADNEDSALSKG